MELDSLLCDWGIAENEVSPLLEAVVLCSRSILELLLSSVMFTDLIVSDVFCSEVLLFPELNDCLTLSKRVFDCLGTVFAWGIRGVDVTDSACSDSTELCSKVPSKVPSGSLSSGKSIGGSDSWAENAVQYDFVGSQHSASGFRLELFGLLRVRKLLRFRLLRSITGYMRGISIGNIICLVDSIDREGRFAKVS